MPHELAGQVHWHEPAGLEPAGRARFRRAGSAYDQWMAGEGVPVHRGVSVRLAGLALGAWARLGGLGCFVQLEGGASGPGFSVVEVPGGGALAGERHLFDKVALVLEGRGTTEVWRASGGRHLFEWQEGAMFAVPLNARHRLVNASDAPARVLMISTAPSVLGLLGVPAVFGNAFVPDDEDDAFVAYDDVLPDPVRDLAVCRTRLMPDVLGCDLPLDNRLSPGWRQLSLEMTQAELPIVIGQHRPGRYGRGVLLAPGQSVLCLGGLGTAFLWPERLGVRPWAAGLAGAVTAVALERFTLFGAGAADGRWFCQCFPEDGAALRLAVIGGEAAPGLAGAEMVDPWAVAVSEGGGVVPYGREDPVHRGRHAAAMAACGAVDRMRDADYRLP